jgi:hypothetical protein
VELSDDLAGFDKGRNSSFDGGNSDCFCLSEPSRPIVLKRAIVLADGIR